MTAYVVFGLQSVSDPNALRRYRQAGRSTLLEHGATFIGGPDVVETLEGPHLAGAVMLAFESVDAAQGWYRSPEYQACAGVRIDATTGFAFIVAGRD